MTLFLVISQPDGGGVGASTPGGGTRRHQVAELMLTWQELRWPQGGHVRWQLAAGRPPVWAALSQRTERQVTPSQLPGSSMTSPAPAGGNWGSQLPVHMHTNGSPEEHELATEEHFFPMSSSTLILLLGNLWKVRDQLSEKKIKTKHTRVSSFCAYTSPKHCSPHGYSWGLCTWWSEGSGEVPCYWLVHGFLFLCVW